ncbi:PLDc N-terminal domain-containing protein [Leucobacter allii]|uniref:PLDc N-terminal domain-containing protein n=1 Tax=Leucobacter allii TaxID=2932247 RepID=A0ABY4FKM7_9MICO|nr:PLDc N-terminal domain-containing protein [Leucobacter allii]UOQ56741.1 PLDc N-terminal domain-containing protein [Leucobacter allii]
MVRFVIIGIVIAVAFTLYALVDAAMTDGSRARGVGKPVWVVLIVVLPVVGGILWFFVGKGSAAAPGRARPAPDDDPRFAGTRMSSSDLDTHMRDLEERLRELDNETFPGERPGSGADPASETADPGGVRPQGPAPGGAASGASDAGTADSPAEPDAEGDQADGPAAPGEPGKRADGDAAAQ